MTSTHLHTAHHDPANHGPHKADGQTQILDLDAQVLREHVADITAWLPLQTPPRQVVDIGSGTGAGTFALLDRFPEAHITAVDASAGHLQRLREKACTRGVQDRLHTVQADLDQTTWPDLGTPDLAWASASMHHMAHPDRALHRIRELLAPNGLFSLVELADFPRFLPDSAPEDRPGLEERCHQASDRLHAHHVPHRGADWRPMLTKAGFTVEGERTVTVNINSSHDQAVGAYALSTLQRIRHGIADTLTPEDLAALDRLLDTSSPHSILHREDLAVRTERIVWAARRAD